MPLASLVVPFRSRVLQGRVWLIDLNPFGEVTDSLLFSWEELTSGEITQQKVSLRDT